MKDFIRYKRQQYEWQCLVFGTVKYQTVWYTGVIYATQRGCVYKDGAIDLKVGMVEGLAVGAAVGCSEGALTKRTCEGSQAHNLNMTV